MLIFRRKSRNRLRLALLPLGGYFRHPGIATLETGHGDLELQFVATQRALVLGGHRIAAEITGHLKRDVVAIDLAVGDFRGSRRSSTAPAGTPAAHSAGNGTGEFGAIGLQGDRHRTALTTVPARLFIGPLAGYVGRKRDERNDKQNCRYKKQLFGHSNSVGVPARTMVTNQVTSGSGFLLNPGSGARASPDVRFAVSGRSNGP